ncbi:hypothetical protein NL317_30665, partial [Klebsiella pneumoniae]|nr:hypothetical protein [Klebsiella pneumoniae]
LIGLIFSTVTGGVLSLSSYKSVFGRFFRPLIPEGWTAAHVEAGPALLVPIIFLHLSHNSIII